MTNPTANRCAITTLAWIGDAVFELCIRLRLTKSNPHISSGTLHHMAIRYVSARGQAMMLRGLLDEHNAESENMILPFDDETKCAASSTTDERDVDFEQTGSDDVPLDNEIDFALSGISNANNMDNRYVDVSVDEGIRCASSYPEENAFIFSGRELNLMRRARNHHTDSQPKNVDIRDYHLATAFETLIGWLWLTDQKNRAFHLIDRALAIADDHPNDE